MPENETIITVDWEDLLNYGQNYEHFTDLVYERVREHEGIDEENDPELFVTAYSFHEVEAPGKLLLSVLWEQSDEEPSYSITPKGELVLTLIHKLSLDYDDASDLADKLIAACGGQPSGEVVGS